MKFKTHQYVKHWTSTTSTATDPKEIDEARQAASQLERLLAESLTSENLIILTGLGTSLCVKDVANNSLAPTMQVLWDAAKSKTKNFDKLLAKVNHPKLPSTEWKIDLETLLSRCQMSAELSGDSDILGFISETEAMIAEMCDFLNLLSPGTGLPVHESFLRKIAKRPTRLPRTKLFTTNYDLCFETAAATAGFIMIDGFSHTNPQGFDGIHFDYDIVRRENESEVPLFVPNVLQLLKLHGSVDWDRGPDGQVRRQTKPKKPVIIYPRAGKFESSYNQPYFEMISRFQSALRAPNTSLLIVGFGCNDAHLVGPMDSALRSNASLKVVAVGPKYETERPTFIQILDSLIDAGDRRLTLIATGFEELSGAIPDLQAQTENEQHQTRLRKVPMV